MKVRKITLQWDDGSITEHSSPHGFGVDDLTMGLSVDSLTSAKPDTPQAVIFGIIQTVLGVLTKRFGL